MDILSIYQQTDKKKKILAFAGLLVASLVLAFLMVRGGVAVASIILLFPLALIFIVISFNKPVVALYALFIFSFFLVAVERYLLKDIIPVGTIVDFLILYVFMLLFLKGLVQKIE